MDPICTVCSHPERDAIDDALATGTTYIAMAPQYKVGPEPVRRHHDNHLTRARGGHDRGHGDLRCLGLRSLRLAAAARRENEHGTCEHCCGENPRAASSRLRRLTQSILPAEEV